MPAEDRGDSAIASGISDRPVNLCRDFEKAPTPGRYGCTMVNYHKEKRAVKRASGFLDLARLDRLGRHPDTLDLTVGHPHANTLQIRAEGPLGILDDVSSDAAAFLRLTFTGDSAPANGTLTGDCTNSGHD